MSRRRYGEVISVCWQTAARLKRFEGVFDRISKTKTMTRHWLEEYWCVQQHEYEVQAAFFFLSNSSIWRGKIQLSVCRQLIHFRWVHFKTNKCWNIKNNETYIQVMLLKYYLVVLHWLHYWEIAFLISTAKHYLLTEAYTCKNKS